VGVVLVQDPATAKFDGMPRSAIDAGLADIVAPVDELPEGSSPICSASRWLIIPPRRSGDKTQSALEKAIILLRAHTGHDFSLYKKNTFYRRIERRMGIHQIDKIADYVRYLRENSQELDLLFKELLIGVTEFLPRPRRVGAVAKKGPPALIGRRPAGRCGRGCRAVPPARRPIPWPWCSRRRWRSSSPGATFRCRSLPPTWTGTRSTRPAGILPGEYCADVTPGA
jgi:hypothetical protein